MRAAAIIPVAGLSSRMGAFKPLLTLNGFPLIQLTVQTVLDAGVSAVAVVTGREGERVRKALRDLDAPTAALGLPTPRIACVANEAFASTDMLQSIKQGLQTLFDGEKDGHAQALDAVLILPGDIPGIAPSTLGQMSRYAQEHEDAAVVVPAFEGRTGHPLLVKRVGFDAILGFEGAGGLKAALARCAKVHLPVSDEAVLFDADDPLAFARLEPVVRRNKGVSPALVREFLDEAQTPQHIRAHCDATSRLAVRMALHLNTLGQCLDTQLCSSAAALHDMHRLQKRHYEVAAQALLSKGYDAVARIVNEHDSYSRALRSPTASTTPDAPVFTESVLVCTADKLVRETQLVTPEERYAPATQKFGADTEIGRRVRHDLLICRRLVDCYQNLTSDTLYPVNPHQAT